ncbi:MAG TPA: hypothetical protein VFJ80_06955 [Candidatus Limnocylindrales bacterium]|nr:hypothetical protein [Candidatus Limnocylindrales bacterium]
MRAPVAVGRPRAAVTALLISIVAFTAFGPVDADARKPPKGLERFREAVGSVESGGDYRARNTTSGARGKYQIMPANWPGWARSYLGDPRAAWSARNQDRVATAKMTALYRWLGSWERVAYWWLTGSTRTRGWTTYARRYVDKVMTRYRGAPARAITRPVAAKPAPSRTVVVDDRSSSIRFSGGWRSARHGGYGGDTVRYAETRGASATLAFTGRSVSWHGPTGPTRGVAKVYVDGRLVRTVDLRRSSFRARATIFHAAWASPGRHTISIVVAGSRGRSMVAIDDLTVRT